MCGDYDYEAVSVDMLQNQVLVVLGIALAVFIVPNLWAWCVRRAWWPSMVRAFDRCACVCACVLFAPVVWCVCVPVAWVRGRLFPAAESRRKLGRYLAALPPHNGLTYYEEMAIEIESLPPGPAKMALRQYFKKVAPPSAECIARARQKRGMPRVKRGITNALLRGKIPYIMQGKGVVA